ncbi:putative acylaminoacyl-peptidase [Indibacter alkaliphilus LW1]|uniref:Acylaminoacyl-peptidase n=1 Tax=Indibacter alkaliphilus (strain CCUG 57479 / KCTC 22604 / LW1) TaxID=1189612 RepID=S2DKW0_INDAL|nr:prolyl oligopeptidase family serine peptidase [Indibacter alkaliphilus]EOZ92596.1 putative acylaminoacyl-peptidase [Indibacter alkaliphilus LW1]
MKLLIYKYLLVFHFLLFTLVAYGQQKRSLTHDDYDGWESISAEKITKNGDWLGYEINPQDGDGRLEVVSHSNPINKIIIPRGGNWNFSHDSKFAFGKIVPERDSVRYLKLKKAKSDQMPKDSLFIVNLESENVEKFARVKSYSHPKKKGNWIAIHFEKDKPVKAKDDDKADSLKNESDTKDRPRNSEGTKLLVRSLDGQKKFEFHRVKEYGFSDNGDFFFYIKAEEDTLKNTGIFLLNLATGISKIIDVRKTEYLSPAFSSSNKYLAYLTTEDSTNAKKPYYDLYLYEIANESNQKILHKESQDLEGMISKHGRLFFSKDENRLFFGTAPDYKTFAYEEDTTILTEERVSLDIWGWQDAEIQPMQLRNKSREEQRNFLTAYEISNRKIIPLGDERIPSVNVDKNAKHKIGIGVDDSPYRRSYSWDIQIGKDVYIVNLENGHRYLMMENLSGNPQLSPEGKFVYWYSMKDSSWIAFDLASRSFKNMTKKIGVNFYDELHDSPSMPSSYGAAGWLKGDSGFLVYDKYDVWKVDPSGTAAPVNLTAGEGRKRNITFRRQKLDAEEETIDPSKPLLLTAFQEFDKRDGFFLANYTEPKPPEELLFTDHRYFGFAKAKENERIIVRRSTYKDNPDIYSSDLSMKELKRISSLNPQQTQVKWGSVELINYRANDGEPMQGLLFKPENFDTRKKYPMMVYFYERNSDGLHNYRAPVPSASIINIPFFVSNDYLVFVPDIKYELGLPGPSAYNCIIPGVHNIIDRGFVDRKNIAIQGQSWGGYQVAHLITRTNMFKAAGAGAPVVNMTSAYGGIRWGTGMSRMFQYEQTQSRIGGTLWEKPMYYMQNSPLFYMDRVETPVLIMHNDADGAVPWYQGIEMFMALKRLNKPAWLLQYNDEDHNLRLRKNRKDLSVRLSQFFDHYLKGAPAPLWMTEGLPAVEKGRTLKYELSEEEDGIDY